MSDTPTNDDLLDELIQDAMAFGGDDPAPYGHVRTSRAAVRARMVEPPDEEDAALLKAAIALEFEWNFDRTPERRAAADEAQRRLLAQMRSVR